MPAIHSLPPELLGYVFDHLDRADLLNLCTLSIGFVPPAQERLFRSFPGPLRTADKLQPFIQTLIRRPDLAKLVTELDLCSDVPVEELRGGPLVNGYLRTGLINDEGCLLESAVRRLGLLEASSEDINGRDEYINKDFYDKSEFFRRNLEYPDGAEEIWSEDESGYGDEHGGYDEGYGDEEEGDDVGSGDERPNDQNGLAESLDHESGDLASSQQDLSGRDQR